jgi:hypothetical protein
VIAIGTDCDRSLRALKLGMFGSRGLANRTAAIPLRNTTTRRGAQDDDAKHDPSPGMLLSLEVQSLETLQSFELGV